MVRENSFAGGTATGQRWCILRTSAGRTLPLARSLADSGIEVWTPSETLTRRRPRSKVKFEVEAPIMPTFVFARARHLADLLATVVSTHPPFSVFRFEGRVPLINDSEIEGLRSAEQRAKRRILKAQLRTFAPGEQVKLEGGPFAGMSGIVEDGDGKFALVSFSGRMRVKIATFLLIPDGVENGPRPTKGPAAQAA